MSAATATITSSVNQGAEFLRRVAQDDTFRARFEARPDETLREYGIFLAEGLPTSVTLPSKQDAQRALAQLVASAETHLRPTAMACPACRWEITRPAA